MARYLAADELKLYTLIWQRFVASQMTPALFDVTDVLVEAGRYGFKARARSRWRPGSCASTARTRRSSRRQAAPGAGGRGAHLEAAPGARRGGGAARSRSSSSTQKFTQPPPRFTESTLVKALEENGIGRPSTYAQIIATLSDRSYVDRQKGTFFPTELGKLVNRLLIASFGDLINESYTARMEEELDEIAEGKLDWRAALAKFWATFTDDLERAKAEMTSVKGQGVETKETCPTCGAPMVLRFGRYGEYLACSNYPTCKTTREPGAPGVTGRSTRAARSAAPRWCSSARVSDSSGRARATRSARGSASWSPARRAPTPPRACACPSCGEGELVEKRSRRGRSFWGCNRYPKCTFTLPAKPVPHPCPSCGAPFVMEKKTVRRGVEWVCAREGAASASRRKTAGSRAGVRAPEAPEGRGARSVPWVR